AVSGAAATSSSFSWTSSPTNPSNYTVTATDAVGNSGSATAISFSSDTSGPTVTVTTASVSSAYLSGSTMYYKGNGTGNFTLTATLSDGGAGVSNGETTATFPAIATTGWTHNSESPAVSGAAATSSSFSWTASPTNPSNYTVTATDAVGNSGSATAITFTSDTTAPTITISSIGSVTHAYLSGSTIYYKGNGTCRTPPGRR